MDHMHALFYCAPVLGTLNLLSLKARHLHTLSTCLVLLCLYHHTHAPPLISNKTHTHTHTLHKLLTPLVFFVYFLHACSEIQGSNPPFWLLIHSYIYLHPKFLMRLQHCLVKRIQTVMNTRLESVLK